MSSQQLAVTWPCPYLDDAQGSPRMPASEQKSQLVTPYICGNEPVRLASAPNLLSGLVERCTFCMALAAAAGLLHIAGCFNCHRKAPVSDGKVLQQEGDEFMAIVADGDLTREPYFQRQPRAFSSEYSNCGAGGQETVLVACVLSMLRFRFQSLPGRQ
jgi:hypothetical protein